MDECYRFVFMEKKKQIHMVNEPKRHEFAQVCYGIIGCMQEVHNNLGAGLPEYIYQEALSVELTSKGYVIYKEMEYHPMYKGKELKSYLKMDLVVESSVGNIIIECKALTQLTEREHYQTFGYLRGTGWPIAILVNFGTYPKAQIERFHCNDGVIEVF